MSDLTSYGVGHRSFNHKGGIRVIGLHPDGLSVTQGASKVHGRQQPGNGIHRFKRIE